MAKTAKKVVKKRVKKNVERGQAHIFIIALRVKILRKRLTASAI